ncbi:MULTISPECIES: SNF2-related protein [unclassified Campylobacter]|uniref:SNF2-related protein n=1 Tax=unclassified Campylobacter TaxID=2593542 RepID=UPI001EE3A6A8|nr:MULTISPECIES: SNF2-related protein [unclassified Campylobacter]
MTKIKNDDLMLFVIDEFGEFQPNLELTQGKIQKDERIDNASKSKLSQNTTERSDLQNAFSMVYRQENRHSRTQDYRAMDKPLSQDNENAGRFTASQPSTSTNTNGAKNFNEQGSTNKIQSRNDTNGDIRSFWGRSRVLFNEETKALNTDFKSKLERREASFSARRIDASGENRLNTQGYRSDRSGSEEQSFHSTKNRGDTNPREFTRATSGENKSLRQSNLYDDGQDLFAAQANAGELEGNTGTRQSTSIEKEHRELLQTSKNNHTNNKIDFSTNEEPNLGSLKDKFRKNIQAITLLKTLENEDNRPATKEEQEVLSKFSGWGGISSAFDPYNKEWQKEYKELVDLLDDEEYKAARNSTQDAFYTPKIVIDTIYKGLDTMGFNTSEDKNIFEPSAGIGNFLAYAKNYASNYNFTCIELDNISARLLQKLYPNQDIRNHGFENFNFIKKFDAFIGNPPFGQKKIIDITNYELNKLSVHNYFLAKSIDNLKEDGIAAFVVSRYFLDSKNEAVREFIDQKATFLGAIRLPNTMFSKIANTEVTSDIVFFKKGKNENISKKWLESKSYFENIDELCLKNGFSENEAKNFKINEYYKANPQNILGKMKLVNSQFGFSLECVDDGRNLETALNQFINSLPKNIYKYSPTIIQDEIIIINEQNSDCEYMKYKLNTIKDYNYFVYNNEVYFKLSGFSSEYMIKKPHLNEHDKRRIIKLVALRDQFNTLIELEKSDLSDDELKIHRNKLNELYDSFVKTEGFLNKDSNKRAFREDIEANKILALEKNYNAGISKSVALKEGISPIAPSATKSDIFYKRTISAQPVLNLQTPKEALIASINQYGRIHLGFLKDNLAKPIDETLQELLEEKLIFKNHTDDSYILAQKYLSGNVKAKYKEVERLVKDGKNEFIPNLESLKEILPKDLKASDISVSLGTSWIPLKYYSEFFEKTFSIQKENYDLFFNEKTGEWNFSGFGASLSVYTRSLYATERIGAFELALHALKRNPIRIYDKVEEYDSASGKYKTKQILNAKETALANIKLEKLKNDFAEWIYKDFDRRSDLEKIYNERFNTNVEPKYNGKDLILPNLNKNIQLRVHQKNAIYKAIQENSIIFDHQVGAGKTLVAICSIIEQKRMGLINKALIIVPNHLAKQWNDEFYSAYPSANILAPSENDLKKDNREKFFAKIAANDYDAIIMTHSQFKLLPAPYSIQKEQYEQDIEILEYTLRTKQSDNNVKKYSVKELEKRIDNFKAKLADLQSSHKKSKSIDFSELGIDTLIVDEAHEFKNLLITTSMGDISGLGNLKGSQKAYDLYCKTQYLHKNNHKLYFLTGTPISNSITELFTLQRYIQPSVLKEKRIHIFDSWASTFGEVTSAWELDSSGINYKIVSRFNKFKNVPELATMYKSVADIVTNADIMKFQKDFVPKLYNNKPINVVAPRSDEIAEFIGIQDENGMWNEDSIVWRMENQDKDIRRNNLLACTTDARKAGLDFRLIDPNAKDYVDSKVNKLVQNVLAEYKAYNNDKGTQLIFCDLSTPKRHSQKITREEIANTNEIEQKIEKEEFVNINEVLEKDEEEVKSLDEILAEKANFDVYSDILKKLVNMGIPQNEIRFIHDAKTDLQKAALFADMNSGTARILIGSTQKMGAGTNVQKRVVALHHLDCPWRPSDLEQRSGRVIRQGNELFMRDPINFRIKEFRYATERTYDARMWQTIESKAKSIEQFRSAGADTRTLDDITSSAADAAEMKAEATGNPFILMQVQLNNDLRQEEMLYNNFQRQIYHNEETLKNLQSKFNFFKEEITKLQTFKDIISQHKEEHFKGKYFIHNLNDKTSKTKDFLVFKNDDSEANKSRQETLKQAFNAAVKLVALDYEKEYDILEYKGLIISAEKTSANSLCFYISTQDKKLFIEPENMVYSNKANEVFKIEDYVSFSGFITRMNNFYNGIDKTMEETNEKIKLLHKDIVDLQRITGENTPSYTRKEYLEALREDNRLVIEEIEKISTNKDYKSEFVPKSAEILNSLNKTKENIQEFEK